jgi:hypothetical protein
MHIIIVIVMLLDLLFCHVKGLCEVLIVLQPDPYQHHSHANTPKYKALSSVEATATMIATAVAREQQWLCSSLLSCVRCVAGGVAAVTRQHRTQQHGAAAAAALPQYAADAVQALTVARDRVRDLVPKLAVALAPEPSYGLRFVHLTTTAIKSMRSALRKASNEVPAGAPAGTLPIFFWDDMLPAAARVRGFAFRVATDGTTARVYVTRRPGRPTPRPDRLVSKATRRARRAGAVQAARAAVIGALPAELRQRVRQISPPNLAGWGMLRAPQTAPLQRQQPQGPRGVRVVAVDPGMGAMFTAFTASDDAFLLASARSRGAYTPPGRAGAGEFGRWLSPRSHRVITSDWFTMVGIRRQELWFARHKRKRSLDAAVMAALPRRDTLDLDKFVEHCRATTRIYGDAAARLYATRRHAQQTLRGHGLEERARQRIAQQLFWGYTRVRGRGGVRAPLPPEHEVAETAVVFWGTGYYGLSRGPISGRHPPIARTLDWVTANLAALQRPMHPASPTERARPRHAFLLEVDEAYTSQACNQCWRRTMEQHRYHGDESWAVKRCSRCGVVVNRDVLAAINIFVRSIAVLLYAGGHDPRLEVFGDNYYAELFGADGGADSDDDSDDDDDGNSTAGDDGSDDGDPPTQRPAKRRRAAQ